MIYLLCSIGFVIGIVSGCCVSSYLFRRQIRLHKAAVESIMYVTHHQGINPISKRIRGLTNLGSLGIARIMNYFDLLSGREANMSITRSAMKESSEVKLLFEMIESEALNLEKEVLDKVKEFEHLQ